MEKSKYNKSLVIVIAAIASTGGLLFGFDTGVISGALPFLERSWDLSTEEQEWIVTALLVGAIAGALSSGRLALVQSWPAHHRHWASWPQAGSFWALPSEFLPLQYLCT